MANVPQPFRLVHPTWTYNVHRLALSTIADHNEGKNPYFRVHAYSQTTGLAITEGGMQKLKHYNGFCTALAFYNVTTLPIVQPLILDQNGRITLSPPISLTPSPVIATAVMINGNENYASVYTGYASSARYGRSYPGLYGYFPAQDAPDPYFPDADDMMDMDEEDDEGSG